MRIGILGTRGIPNRYGGFEEFAEQVCKCWADEGHEVFVYCEDKMQKEPFKYQNVFQEHIKPSRLSGLQQIVYDYRCTKHALNLDLDIIYHAGYASAVIGNILLKQKLKGRLVYNMDGLEWKRSKFNGITRWITKQLEKAAATSGARLVSDNKGIKEYLLTEYKVDSTLIEYGAKKFEIEPKLYSRYPECFDLVIARFEPENHIKEIIAAYENINYRTLVLVANKETNLYKKLGNRIDRLPNVIFNGPIYDKEELAFLKKNCRYYIHGHSVGGTNPSLLEALAAGCSILIHANEFNRDVVQEHALSWDSQSSLEMLIAANVKRVTSIKEQQKYCSERFDWQIISQKHLDLFQNMMYNSFIFTPKES